MQAPAPQAALATRGAHRMKKRNGFTLIELILVVSTIITLALIAIPSYNKSKLKAMGKEAVSNLRLLAAAERIYRMENTVYTTCTDAADCNSKLKLMLNTANWLYAVSGNASAVTATATYVPNSGCTYSISSANFDAAPVQSGGSGCP